MSAGRCVGWVLICLVLAATAGCVAKPRVVIVDLPVESILAPPVEAAVPKRTTESPPRKKAEYPQSWTPQALARPWRWIVVHHSASESGSAATFDRWHRARGWDELGYHFVITNGRGGDDGNVEVGSRWTKQKWGAHCKTPDNRYNDFGVGICLVGDFRKSQPTAAQLRSLRRLATFLVDRYGIDPANVIGHRDAPGTTTVCPGDKLARYIREQLRPWLLGRAEAKR